MYGKGLRPLSIATVAMPRRVAFPGLLLRAAGRHQGFIQKIFYLHVPLAITALVGFVIGGVFAIATCAAATGAGTPTPTSRFTCR